MKVLKFKGHKLKLIELDYNILEEEMIKLKNKGKHEKANIYVNSIVYC